MHNEDNLVISHGCLHRSKFDLVYIAKIGTHSTIFYMNSSSLLLNALFIYLHLAK